LSRLIFDQSERVAAWVVANIPHMAGWGDFGACKAIGVVDDHGQAIAGAVFHDYQPKYKTVQLSMAATSPRWATRGNIYWILRYPFEEIGINKVWTATSHLNERALRFNEGIGFKREAVLAHHFGHKQHAVICRMFRSDYARLVERLNHGKVLEGTRAA
jgi:RimJ/RimL family protein N-acetyltransferase